jgi:hypothetical protein
VRVLSLRTLFVDGPLFPALSDDRELTLGINPLSSGDQRSSISNLALAAAAPFLLHRAAQVRQT